MHIYLYLTVIQMPGGVMSKGGQLIAGLMCPACSRSSHRSPENLLTAHSELLPAGPLTSDHMRGHNLLRLFDGPLRDMGLVQGCSPLKSCQGSRVRIGQIKFIF